MAGKLSVLNANYIKESLKDYYKLPIDGLCKHEFVFDGLKEEYGGDHHEPGHVTTLDVAKRLLDYGFHAPTIYFPLLFHEAMMIEPTETESKETLDEFIAVMKEIALEARDDRDMLKTAPHHTPVSRPDDVKAVKEPKFTFKDYQ
jgi:glycine dehydrogenase subunit 2